MSIQINNLSASNSKQLVDLTVDEALAINGGMGPSPRATYDGGGGSGSTPKPAPSSNNSSNLLSGKSCPVQVIPQCSPTPDPFRLNLDPKK